MVEVRQTSEFSEWLKGLRDVRARTRIAARLARIQSSGHFGDIAAVGDGVFELRFFFGPGYRVYYTRMGETVVILLAGGDKTTQKRDIERARQMVVK